MIREVIRIEKMGTTLSKIDICQETLHWELQYHDIALQSNFVLRSEIRVLAKNTAVNGICTILIVQYQITRVTVTGVCKAGFFIISL